MKTQSRTNRDVTRQNKATSVVKATMLSLCCRDSLSVLSDLLEDLRKLLE